MSENVVLTRAVVALVAVVALSTLAVLVGVRTDKAYGQVADRAGSFMAVTGAVSTRGEQVVYLVDTREQIMIVYKYDDTRKALLNIAQTNVEADINQAKLILEESPGALTDEHRFKKPRRR